MRDSQVLQCSKTSWMKTMALAHGQIDVLLILIGVIILELISNNVDEVDGSFCTLEILIMWVRRATRRMMERNSRKLRTFEGSTSVSCARKGTRRHKEECQDQANGPTGVVVGPTGHIQVACLCFLKKEIWRVHPGKEKSPVLVP